VILERKHKSKEKYGLLDMEVDDYKDFKLDLYSKIRNACYFAGKRHERKYSTRKLKRKTTDNYFIRVYRVA